MSKFILPDKVTIKLIKSPKDDFPVDNILLYIKTYARHKNDIHLGPFISDKHGIVTIKNKELENTINDTYDSGLMDYSSIENSFAFIEIRLYQQDEIKEMIKSRSKFWTSLFKGEKERWDSSEHMIDTLKNSNNKLLNLNKSINRLRAEFDGTLSEYEFQFNIYKK